MLQADDSPPFPAAEPFTQREQTSLAIDDPEFGPDRDEAMGYVRESEKTE